MPFPWDNLITAVSTLAAGIGAGIGGAWLRGRSDGRRDDRAVEAARTDRQREAYAALVTTARVALRNFRQLGIAYGMDRTSDPDAAKFLAETDAIATDLTHAIGTVELLGSSRARKYAKDVYDKAKACANPYQTRSASLAVAERLLGTRRPSRSLVPFDAATSSALCDALADAVESFIDAVRPELGADT